MNNGKRLNIKQVAREAGVSTQTVSRVLNNRPDVAPETRKRVQETIDRLGYQPSSLARGLIQGRTRTLGVVGTGLEYFGPSQTLVGIVNQANALGYTLYLSLLQQPEKSDVGQILQTMYAQHVDGIVWAVPEIASNRDWVHQEMPAVPMVFLTMAPRPDLSSISVDNRTAAAIATRHLLEQGHRQVGLITGPIDWWEARERRLGWRDALDQAGLPGDDSLVAFGNWSAASGEKGLRRLRQVHPDLTAIFCSNDQMALGVLRAAREVGLRVPEDLALVGFDDIPESAYFCPSLSTIQQDMASLGSTAVGELDRLIELSQQGVEADSRTISLSIRLIVRESSVAH